MSTVKSRPDVKVRIKKDRDVVRSVEQVSLGCHFVGAAAPHPDTADPKTLEQGVLKRIGRKMPKRTSAKFLARLKAESLRLIRKHGLEPIEADYQFLFEDWLAGTNYEQWRKEELTKIHLDIVDMLERNDKGELKHFKIKLFMKDEGYMQFKQGRGIYAREDVAKVYFGPFFKAIEMQVYYDPSTGKGIKHFIKHIPVDQRAGYVMEEVFMEGFRNVCTDYTSLESHFDKELMMHCEFPLYEHLLGSNPWGRQALSIMEEVLTGKNVIQSKFLSTFIQACRMSGEMNTSLGNGWSNLTLFSLWCFENGIELIGVIEGDDGLFSIPPYIEVPTPKYFKTWGCLIKIDVFEEISRASFCGLVFDPQDRCIVSDPFKILLNFGYASKRYSCSKQTKLKALLRAKAMSTLVQYHGCPIVSTLAKKMLELTRSIDVRHVISQETDSWKRTKLQYAASRFGKYLECEIGIRTRILFEELYGIPVDVQIRIEEHLNSMTEIVPIFLPELLPCFPADCLAFYDSYACRFLVKNGRFLFFQGAKIS